MAEHKKTVVLVSDNPKDREGVTSAISTLTDIHLEERDGKLAELNGESIELAGEHELIIFRADATDEQDFQAIREINSDRDRKSRLVALTSDATSLADVQKLRRAGVNEVVPDSITTEELREIIDSATRFPVPAIVHVTTEAKPLGRVIAVSKARGGIGASLMAANLADVLLEKKGRGKKRTMNKVVLIDLDLQFGSISSLLDVKPNNALYNLSHDGSEPDWTFLEQALEAHPSGLKVLAAPASFAPLDALTNSQMDHLITLLSQKFDYVVVDLPRALVSWLSPLLEHTHQMLLVTDSSVPSIRQARRLIDFFTEDNLDLKIDIVINHEKKPFIRGRHHTEASKVLERPFQHWIPMDPKAAKEAVDRGKPLSEVARRSPMYKSISRLGKATAAEIAKHEDQEKAQRG